MTTGSLTDQLATIAGESALSTWTEPSSARELPLITPPDEAACVRALQLATENQLALIPIGLGGKTSQTRAAKRADFALSMRGVAGVEAYEPGDGTVTVRAGTTMSELQAVVNAGGHRLTPDVPLPDRSTIGGVIAAGQSGFDRLRFGPMRNHVLGLRVLLGDGTAALTGGRLVKNVTGYDLQRLYAGSRGSLCLIVEASLRLFPLPESELVFTGQSPSLEIAMESLRRACELPLTWDTLNVAGQSGDYRVLAALSGRSAMLSSHRSNVEACLADLDSLQTFEGELARTALDSARDAELTGGWPHLRLLCRPSELSRQSELIFSALRELSESPPRIQVHPRIATLDLWLSEPDSTRRSEQLIELFEVAAAHSLRIEWLGSQRALAQELALSDTTTPALRLMTKLQSSLDPAGVFARGRFLGGL